MLTRVSLLKQLDIVVGGDEISIPKSDSEGKFTTIKRLKVSTSRFLYVVDRLIDAEMARRAGVPFVEVIAGVTPTDDLDIYDVYGKINSLSSCWTQ